VKSNALALVLLLSCAAAEERTHEGVGLTIYSSPVQTRRPQNVWNPHTGQWEAQEPGFAIVKEWRKLRLSAGRNTIRFADVAARIDPTTVHFRSVTDPEGTSVVEQNFEFDLVSAEKILSKYVDREIGLELEGGRLLQGTLLAYDGGQLVLRTQDPQGAVQILQRATARNLKFGELPGGLITRPTLVWLLEAEKEGEHVAKVTYQTGGMRWNADYTVVLAPDDRALDLSGWVTIDNRSGASYKDAELKLVAGDVHRAEPEGATERRRAVAAAKADFEGDFVEKAFFEYHLYTLQRTTTLPDSSMKQIELFDPVNGVPARKQLVYYGGAGAFAHGGSPYMDRDLGIQSNDKVDVYVAFRNGKEERLGLPLPAGRVRVYKKDPADGSLELVGEDAIDHTPKDERVRLKLGSAFDVKGERKQTDFQVDTRGHWLRESFEIRLRNHKEEEVEVIVKENLYRWSNWTIEAKSHEFTKEDARTVHFLVKVPANGETVVTYTVRYTW